MATQGLTNGETYLFLYGEDERDDVLDWLRETCPFPVAPLVKPTPYAVLARVNQRHLRETAYKPGLYDCGPQSGGIVVFDQPRAEQAVEFKLRFVEGS